MAVEPKATGTNGFGPGCADAEGITNTSTPGASPQQQFACPVIKWRLNSSQNVGVVLQRKKTADVLESQQATTASSESDPFDLFFWLDQEKS
ncbi:hypothetical protein ACLKA7_017662 [Drosophila subpalustris]